MVRLKRFSIASLLLLGSCGTHPELPWESADLRPLTLRTLEKFESRDALDDYLRQLSIVAKEHDLWWASSLKLDSDRFLAQLDPVAPETVCDPEVENCALDTIVLTGSRVTATPSITNNQESNVDEGDIVKTFDRFLIVLQDGRLFSIDTGNAPANGILVDRIDVYRDPEIGAWYDELLIHDNTLVVIGYTYELEASELVVFGIDGNGLFEHKVTYYIGSDDYYSGTNYASRVVDGNLVIYTPLYVSDFLPDEPVAIPDIRHWTELDGYSAWRPLFGAEDIYRPVLQSLDPVVHAVSVCPIELAGEWDCRSTGFIGPAQRELYVTEEYVYLWNASEVYDWISWEDVDDCSEADDSSGTAVAPAALYRIPLTGTDREATAVLTAGIPDDQFSLEARPDEFLALLYWPTGYCDWDSDQVPMRYLRFPTSAFSTTVRELPERSYHEVPQPEGYGIQSRFAENVLVYSGSQGLWKAFTESEYTPTELIIVPIDDPRSLRRLPLAHSAERIELFGENVVINGYQLNTGLSVSLLDLRDEPRLGLPVYVDRVLESEGRSHAFNYLVEPDGSGVMGFPTVFKDPGNRIYWDRPSNIHFVSVDSNLNIRLSGHLEAMENAEDPSYDCSLSCYDWYGNARPIFFRDRVFALTGTELIEGQFVGGQIAEIHRVNMTGTPRNRR